MKCTSCGFENPEGFAFCGRCGSSLEPICPQCGFKNPPGFGFCGRCGAPLTLAQDRLTPADLDHLRAYLPPTIIEALRFKLQDPPPELLTQSLSHLTTLLDAIYTHLPPYLVEWVLENPTPGKVGGRFLDGTLLFADISGFTAMSERLSRIGREGAEEINSIVNRYFSTMLSILREHHGQLVGFGGDALLGLFFEPDSATRAVQAAHRMQAAMVAFSETQTSQGTFAVQMKVGICRGRFFSASPAFGPTIADMSPGASWSARWKNGSHRIGRGSICPSWVTSWGCHCPKRSRLTFATWTPKRCRSASTSPSVRC